MRISMWQNLVALFKFLFIPKEPIIIDHMIPSNIPPEEPTVPVAMSNPDVLNPDWSTQKNAYHNVRVLCDLSGLTFAEKNIICACIYQESEFKINVLNNNRNAQGKILSTDYGICQINDYYHIGKEKDFPSVEYVLDNPEACVQFMINCYLHGALKQWVSFSSGAYKQWLLSTSPMWNLGK